MGNTTQQTAAQKAAAKAAKEVTAQAAKEAETKDAVFDANPQLDVYYKTSDGIPFFTKNAAELHSAGLTDKTIKEVTK
jgi:hypothetical protein